MQMTCPESTAAEIRLSMVGIAGEAITRVECPDQQIHVQGLVVDSEQRYRWVISTMMEIEHRLHKLNGFRQLHQLTDTIENHILLEPENFNKI
jgi:hypothetical protein